MKSSQVRDLARRYAAGQLSQENYRSQRRSLIDAIAGGQQPLSYREQVVKTAAHSGRMKLAAVAVVAVLLVAVGIKFAWKAIRAPHKTPAEATAAAPAVVALSPGPELVRSFVETNDWTDGSLDHLVLAWGLLPPDEQSKARGSELYPRLVANLRQQMASEKAMAGSSTIPGPHFMELQKVAKTIGAGTTP